MIRSTCLWPAAAILVVVTACGSDATGVSEVGLPVVTSIQPDSLEVGSEGQTVVVRGEGFLPGSVVLVDRAEHPTAFISTQELETLLDDDDVIAPRLYAVSVSNPGGGVSGEKPLAVVYPSPVLSGVTPDTVFAGVDTRLRITGRRLRMQTSLIVQGQSQVSPLLVVGDSIMYVDLPARLASLGTLRLELLTGASHPSSPVDLTVLASPPEITVIQPTSIVAGSGPLTLTLSGKGLGPSGQVFVDGVPRSFSYVAADRLEVDLAAADVANPGSLEIRVADPGRGTSKARLLSVVPASPAMAFLVSGMNNTDMVFDPTRDLIYVTVPNGPWAHANELVAVDPASLTVAWSVPVGVHPWSVAITDDGAFAYVGLGGASKVVRVDLNARAVALEIPLPTTTNGITLAEDVVTLPGLPHTVVVSLMNVAYTGRSEGVVVFDDTIARPRWRDFDVNRLTASSDPGLVFATNPESATPQVVRLAIAEDGIDVDSIGPVMRFSLGGVADITYDDGLVFNNFADVFHATTFDLAASWKLGSSAVTPEGVSGRAYVWVGSKVYVKELNTFTEIGTVDVPPVSGYHRMIRYGAHGLAIGLGDSIIFAESDLFGG